MMKRWLILILSFCLAITVTACGSNAYTAPPGFRVICGDEEVRPYIGTYSWFYTKSFGRGTGIDVCGIHPLDRDPYFVHLTTTETTATLQFFEDPVNFSISCWSDEYLGNPGGALEENVVLNGYTFELKPGGYIYEVSARWDGGKEYGGDASYNFYIERE